MNDSLIPISKIYNELKINSDSLRVWCGHLNIKYIKIGRRNYCTQDDALKIKEFYSQPNLKDIMLQLESEKRKKTCQEKYGGDSPMSSQEIKDRMKSAWLEKYGVEHPIKLKEIRERQKQGLIKRYGIDIIAHIPGVEKKRKETCLRKYGVEYSFQSNQMIENSKRTKMKRYGNQNYNNRKKAEETCLEKYGVNNVKQSEAIKEKGVQTCLEKYGCEYYTQSQDMKNKSAKTCLEKYGVERPLQSKEFQDKSAKTCLEKYGVEHPLQSKVFLKKVHKKWKIQELDGVSFASKEEAYYYVYLKDNNYDFEYQVEYPKPYVDNNGVNHIFIADFKVGDEYIEIKGDQFFDSKGDAQFIYNRSDAKYNLRMLSLWQSKLDMIKSNDDIKLILSSTFDKNGDNFHMKQYFDKNYKLIKIF